MSCISFERGAEGYGKTWSPLFLVFFNHYPVNSIARALVPLYGNVLFVHHVHQFKGLSSKNHFLIFQSHSLFQFLPMPRSMTFSAFFWNTRERALVGEPVLGRGLLRRLRGLREDILEGVGVGVGNMEVVVGCLGGMSVQVTHLDGVGLASVVVAEFEVHRAGLYERNDFEHPVLYSILIF